MERQVEINKKYRHFKGHIIKVICIATNTETKELEVIYEHTTTKEIWARPYNMFISAVDTEKYPDCKQIHRFEEIDD